MADVTVKYKDSTIAEIGSDGGTKTLKTSGKYCEGDIEITYELPRENLILSSIESDKTPYNGGIGYKEGYRLNSSGIEKTLEGGVVSGFIPFTGGTVEVRVPSSNYSGVYNYLHVYDSSFAIIKKDSSGATIDASYHQLGEWVKNYGATYVDEGDAIKFTIPAASLAISGTAYIRVSAYADRTINSDTFALYVN